MIAVWTAVWLLTAALAYYNTKTTFVECCKLEWDKATKEFVIVGCLLLGPVFLLISLELRMFAAIGRGLAGDQKRMYKDV